MTLEEIQRRLKELNALKSDGTVPTKEFLERAEKFRDDLYSFKLTLLFVSKLGEYGIFNNEEQQS